MVAAYFDSELVGEERVALEVHLETCGICAAALADLQALREKLAGIEWPQAPPGLVDRIRAELARETARQGESEASQFRTSRSNQGWHARAAGLAAACLISVVVTWAVMSRIGLAGRLEHDVLAAHLRSLVQDSPIQVASSDSHVVKPWFAGRIDFSPSVKDLTAEGYPLIGGRLDYVGDRRVGTLVYKRRNHVVSIFMWATPVSGAGQLAPHPSQEFKGHNILSWTNSGITYWAVSDLNTVELAQLQELL